MASVVTPLVVGIPAAASGSAEFFRHGTSTLSSQVYSDPNAQFAASTHTLDANGSVVRYVTEICDVVVKSAAGSTVRSWTEVVDGRTVRLESTAFTGSNPNGNGQTIAGGRTTLHAGWALYRESQGADDAYVNINGTEYTLKNALGSAGSVFFNVKTGYGAQGNGTADDTSAIQSAINAAQNAGGGVVFIPAGTYKLTGSLTVTAAVSITILGAGSLSTILRQTTTGLSTGWLHITTSFVAVSGLTIDCSPTTITGNNLDVRGNGCVVESCRLLSGAGACIITPAALDSVVSVDGCNLVIQNTGGSWVGFNSTTTRTHFSGCTMTTSVVPSNGGIRGTKATFDGCLLYSSGTSAINFIVGGSGTEYLLSGCRVITAATSGNTNVCTEAGTFALVGCVFSITGGGNLFLGELNNTAFYETGCSWGTAALCNGAVPVQWGHSTTREMRSTFQSVSGTTYVVDIQNYGVHEVTHTSGATMAFSTSGAIYSGARVTVMYKNSTGGAITPTWSSNFSGVPATAVNNGNTALYEFRASRSTVNGELICVTADPVEAAA